MLLGLLFAIIALFYASVGFGGGSSYLALLILWDIPYSMIPIIALICNISVVSGNSFHYVRAGYLKKQMLIPTLFTSVPFAYMGGRLEIEKDIFVITLFIALLFTGIRMLVNFRKYENEDIDSYNDISILAGALIGAVLGFLAGVVGIGGGIFLAPILYNIRAGSPKQIATTCSLFILINSIAGIIGQLHKTGIASSIIDYWFLPILVIIGGQLGNHITLKFLPSRIIALLTGLLVLFVSAKLGWKIICLPSTVI